MNAQTVATLLTAAGATKISEVRRHAGTLKVSCPGAHDRGDKNPSCRIEVKSGSAVYFCDVCGEGGTLNELVQKFIPGAEQAARFMLDQGMAPTNAHLDELATTMAMDVTALPTGAKATTLDEYRRHVVLAKLKDGSRAAPGKPSKQKVVNSEFSGCTLAEYAEAKALPVDVLQSYGLRDYRHPAYKCASIVLPYWTTPDRSEEGARRFRLELTKRTSEDDRRFRWRSGDKPKQNPYGLWRQRIGARLWLVEGESDCHTLWHAGEQALGIPGAGMFSAEVYDPHMQDVAEVIVVIEDDDGGAALEKAIRLSSCSTAMRVVKLNGEEDISSRWVANPDPAAYAAWLNELAASAEAVPEIIGAEQDAQAEADYEQCKEIAAGDDILQAMYEVATTEGFVGEQANFKMVALTCASRYMKKPVSVIITGASSGGKSFTVDTAMSFFDPDGFRVFTSMSPRALHYDPRDYRHRHLVLREAQSLEDPDCAHIVREFVSTGSLDHATTDHGSEGRQHMHLTKEGPVGVITSTTKTVLEPELETRCLILPADDSPEQTKRVLRSISLAAEGALVEQDRDAWHALSRWIGHGECVVVVPFATTLDALVEDASVVRIRRDWGNLIQLVMAHTVLHQATRKRDHDGRLIATLTDYDRVRTLIEPLMARSNEVAYSDTVKATWKAVKAACDDLGDGEAGKGPVGATVAQLRALMPRIGDRNRRRRVNEAIEAGLLENIGPRNRMMVRPVLPYLPDDKVVLPTVEAVQEAIEQAAMGGDGAV